MSHVYYLDEVWIKDTLGEVICFKEVYDKK